MHRKLLVIATALIVVAAACSSGDDATTTDDTEQAPTTTSTPTTSAAPATTEPTSTTSTMLPSTTTVPPTTTTEPPPPQVRLGFDGLPFIGQGGAFYEAWLVIDDEPVSAGQFTVSPDGVLADLDSQAVDGFDLAVDPATVTSIVITLEPAGDDDPAPSQTKILAGDVTDGAATLSIDHPAALGTDFADASGIYVLATPTDGDRVNNEDSGVWFLVFPGPTAGLDLPELPEGWSYEGWTVIDGIAATTGTFRSVVGSDDSAPFSGTVRTPNFPGEDYLFNAPEGLTFPVDLRGSTVVVTVEPVPDNDPGPFDLKVLSGPVPLDAELEPVSYPVTTEGFVPPVGAATLTP